MLTLKKFNSSNNNVEHRTFINKTKKYTMLYAEYKITNNVHKV